MQQLFFHIVLFFILFKGFVAQATIPVLPEDFHGINTETYIAQITENEDYVPSMAQTGGIMFELGHYFNDKYPNDKIFSDDYEDELIEKLREFLPDENEAKLRDRLVLLRNSVRLYRSGIKMYSDYVAKKIVPTAYRQVHSADDYDHPDEFSYIQAPDGEFTKIYNFKKFLSYSDNTEETEAIREFEQTQNNEMSIFDKIDYMYKKIDFKKLPSYGRGEKNPLLSDLGVGEWKEGKNIEARLLSPEIYTEKKQKIYIGVHIVTKLGKFVLANNLNPFLRKPLITVDTSGNISDYKVLYPIPLQSNPAAFAHKYFSDFIIPLELELKDPKEAADINVNLALVTCGADMNCEPDNLDLKLNLQSSGREFLPNGFENFFNMAMQTVPLEQSDDFELKKLVVDENNSEQSLRLEFSTNKNVKTFKVFIEQEDGYTRFDAPLISVRDGIIYARFNLMPGQENVDLRNKKFIVSAELNGKVPVRGVYEAKESSMFDAQKTTISLGIILLAFFGGLILNFMPCVFPVLSLKIIALSRTPARKRKSLKRAIRQTIWGIWGGFAIMTLFLCGAKYLGHSLGWGMQFQNMGFLVAMTFVIAVFIIVLPYLDFDRVYKHTIIIPSKWLNTSIGFLTVLLATPCTGPYMATAVGFALSGSYFDIAIIMTALALGLSFPYFLLLCLSKPDQLLPNSGDWLNILHFLMSILLYLTLAWFALLIWRQTGWLTLTFLLLSIIVFMFCFRFYLRLTDYFGRIIDEAVSEKALNRAKAITSVFMLLIFGVLLFFNIHYAQKEYTEKLKINATERVTGIDKELIARKLAEGKNVLLEIKADWCLTCQYNQTLVLTDLNMENWQNNYNLEIITVDWTDFNKDVLDFMEKYGRKGLPFYILFTPMWRDGIVLPELFTSDDLSNMLLSANLR